MKQNVGHVDVLCKSSKFHHFTPILKFLQWLKINPRTEYKSLAVTYETLYSGRPSHLHSLLCLTHNHSTCSASFVTFMNRPSINSGIQITRRSSYHTAPVI